MPSAHVCTIWQGPQARRRVRHTSCQSVAEVSCEAGLSISEPCGKRVSINVQNAGVLGAQAVNQPDAAVRATEITLRLQVIPSISEVGLVTVFIG